jgi:hypothetical protein
VSGLQHPLDFSERSHVGNNHAAFGAIEGFNSNAGPAGQFAIAG